MNTNNEHITPIELITKFLAAECNEQEREEVVSWLNLSDENQKEFDSLAKLWQFTGKDTQQEIINIDKEWQRMQQVISPRQSKVVSLKRVLQLAASVILLLGISILVLKQAQTITLKSGAGQLSNIELPDGSVVSLNAHSKLSYTKDFNIHNRKIALTGEAFFEVAHNKELPFVINANGSQIEVVGTKFNVRAYKQLSEVKVTVIEGTVKFSETDRPTQKTIIQAGETGILSREDNEIQLEQAFEINDISWKTRVVIFGNSRLSEVVAVLQNTYQVDFIVAPNISDCKVTVEFRDKDLDSVLQVLESTLDLKIKKVDGKIQMNGAGCLP